MRSVIIVILSTSNFLYIEHITVNAHSFTSFHAFLSRGCPKIMFTRLNIMIGTVKNHVGFAENKVTILSAFIGSEETCFMDGSLFESPKKYLTA